MAAHLTAQEIYDKEFSVNDRGYSAEEVDAFLDEVIEDYQNYEDQVHKLSSALVSCDEQMKELQQHIARLESEKEALVQKADELAKQLADAPAAAPTPVEEEELTLEQRVERLEKAVFPSSVNQ